MLTAASLVFFACDDDEKKVPETVVTLDRTELNLNVGFSELAPRSDRYPPPCRTA